MAANQDRARMEVLRRRDYPTTGTGVIAVGDMVVADGSGNALKAAGSDDAVADTFLGVSFHAKATDKTPFVVVGTDLIAEMDLASGLSVAGKVGDAVEFDSAGSTAQTVKIASTNPIGRLARAAPVGVTTVMVHFVGLHVRGPVVAD